MRIKMFLLGVFFLLKLAIPLGNCGSVKIITVVFGDSLCCGYHIQAAAADIAFRDASLRYPKEMKDVSNVTIWRPGGFCCQLQDTAAIMPMIAMDIESAMREHNGSTILVTTGCTFEVTVLGDYAREWNVPIISTDATGPILTDARRFPGLVAFPSIGISQLVDATVSLLQFYHWTTVSVLCDDLTQPTIDDFSIGVCRTLQTVIGTSPGFQVTVSRFSTHVANQTETYRALLEETKTRSRVIILDARTIGLLRQIMIIPRLLVQNTVNVIQTKTKIILISLNHVLGTAQPFGRLSFSETPKVRYTPNADVEFGQIGLAWTILILVAHRLEMTNGEYIFLSLSVPAPPGHLGAQSMDWKAFDEFDQDAFVAYQSLITLMNPSTNWTNVPTLLTEIMDHARDSYNWTISDTETEMASDYIIAAYEAVLTMFDVLHESYEDYNGPNILSGRTFRTRFIDRRFNLSTRSFHVAQRGMRVCDVVMARLNVITGKMETAWYYNSATQILASTSSLAHTWRNSARPPTNTPDCGYAGDRCVGGIDKSRLAGGTVGGILLLIILCVILQAVLQRYMDHSDTWWILNDQCLFPYLPPTRSFLFVYKSNLDRDSRA